MIFGFNNEKKTTVVLERIEAFEKIVDYSSNKIIVILKSGVTVTILYRDVTVCISDFINLTKKIDELYNS